MFSAEELAAVRAAAAREGMAPRAWVGEVVCEVAEGLLRPGPEAVDRATLRQLLVLLEELGEVRRVLRNVGGNLNDVARAANSTGEVAAETVVVEQLVARVVGSVDEVVGRVAGWSRAVAGRRGPGRVAAEVATPQASRGGRGRSQVSS
jgi:hypothetical protein